MLDTWPTFHDLVIAYKKCRLHKSPNRSQIQFESRLGENLCLLYKEIHGGSHRPSPSQYFVVTQPKPREIFAAEFRDRVVHHLIVSPLESIWEKKFIYSSFACRLGKGSHRAILYARHQVKKLSQGGHRPVWALQLDVAKFFATIHRPTLCQLLLKHCYHPKLRELIQIIYTQDARLNAKQNPSFIKFIPSGKSWFDQPPEQGIPIGNLTSQWGANIYLTGLDHFIQRELKPEAYLRYSDDLLLLDSDPEKLKSLSVPIDQWLINHRVQRLNPDKTRLVRLSEGISYLGYHLRQVDSSQQPLQVFSEPLKRWKWIQALKTFENTPLPSLEKPHFLAPWIIPQLTQSQMASLNSRLGVFHHCRSYLFRKQSLDQFIKNTTLPKDIPDDFADPWCPFRLKKGYRAIQLR